MSKTFENVLEQVYQLSRGEQLALIASIAQIIVEDEQDVFPEHIVEENRRRLAKYDAGDTTGIPYQDALAYVRER